MGVGRICAQIQRITTLLIYPVKYFSTSICTISLHNCAFHKDDGEWVIFMVNMINKPQAADSHKANVASGKDRQRMDCKENCFARKTHTCVCCLSI